MSTFNKEEFDIKCKEWIVSQKWEDISNDLGMIYFKYQLEELPYKPRYMIMKDKIPFFLNFFQKGDWSNSKKFDGQPATGVDVYKYNILKGLQATTHIQAGLVMYNEQEDKFVFRQLDQLPNPLIFFGGFGCRAKQLKPKYNDVARGYKCYDCWIKYPKICNQCIKRDYFGGKDFKRREMAMWRVDEFADTLTIQPSLLK